MKQLHKINPATGLHFGDETGFTPFGFGLCSAFDDSGFDPQGNGTKGNMKVGTYDAGSDTLATVEADGYFDSAYVSTTMNTGDLLFVTANSNTETALYRVTVSGTDVSLERVAGNGGVYTAADGDTIPGEGIVLLASSLGTAAYTLPVPTPGAELTIVQSAAGTGMTVASTGISIDYTGNTTATFNAVDDVLTLVGVSATQWAIKGNVGSVALS